MIAALRRSDAAFERTWPESDGFSTWAASDGGLSRSGLTSGNCQFKPESAAPNGPLVRRQTFVIGTQDPHGGRRSSQWGIAGTGSPSNCPNCWANSLSCIRRAGHSQPPDQAK